MKKLVLLVMTVLCLCCFTAAYAHTYTYQDIGLTFSLSDTQYSLLTTGNLKLHPAWVEKQGMSQEELAAQWAEDGVLVTAVTLKDDVHVVVSAVQTEQSIRLFDVDQQTSDTRADYRLSYSRNEVLQDEGYDFQSAEWENSNARGRFLLVKYKKVKDGKSVSGYMYRTVRNGYEITVDYQVYGRNAKKSDLTVLDDIMKSLSFTTVLDKPATSVPNINLTSVPPTETNTGKFTIEGTCDPGLKLTGVILRMSSPDPICVETTANKSGKFEMDFKLPEEGVWLMTLTVQNGDVVTEEIVFNTTTYKKRLLPVNLESEIPVVIYDDQLVITGTTLQGTSVQCLCNLDYAKTIKVNSSESFTFKIDTSEAGEYDITLVFSKKNLDMRRYTYTVTRVVTDEQQRDRYREDAVKPSYSTLKSKLKNYTGRVMGYSLYVTDYWQEDGVWMVRMAMKKSKTTYSNIVYVTTTEEPTFAKDAQVMMYGTCIGNVTATKPDGTEETVPGFELLFWD